jgi:hypothetical protein
MLDQLMGGGDLDGVINRLIEDKAGDFLERLVTKVGFSQAQAERFVPLAVKALVPVLKAKLMGEQEGPTEVDTAALASAAEVADDQAQRGIDELAPQLEATLGDSLKEGGLDALTDAAGGLLGKGGLGGLFS